MYSVRLSSLDVSLFFSAVSALAKVSHLFLSSEDASSDAKKSEGKQSSKSKKRSGPSRIAAVANNYDEGKCLFYHRHECLLIISSSPVLSALAKAVERFNVQ